MAPPDNANPPVMRPPEAIPPAKRIEGRYRNQEKKRKNTIKQARESAFRSLDALKSFCQDNIDEYSGMGDSERLTQEEKNLSQLHDSMSRAAETVSQAINNVDAAGG